MQINAFCAASLNPYRNFHRRLFAEDTTDAKGKGKKSYPQRLLKTPLENLASLPDANTLPQPGSTLAGLGAEASRLTGNQAVQQLNEARGAPVSIHPSPPGALPDASAPPFVQTQTSIGIDFGLLKYVKRLAMSE